METEISFDLVFSFLMVKGMTMPELGQTFCFLALFLTRVSLCVLFKTVRPPTPNERCEWALATEMVHDVHQF
jgi:hypothetical protein